MHIAIIGSGRIGGGLARAWRRAGHEITFGARDVADPDLVALCQEIGAKAASVADAARSAPVLVLAMPYGALDDVLAQAGELAGTIVIDATNAVLPGFVLKYGHTTSSGEELQKRIPKAKVIRSFNAQGAENLEQPVYDGIAATNFYCGDDAEAKAVVRQLVAEVGFDPVDAGPLSASRMLEPLMTLWIACSRTVGSRDIAFRLLRRS